MKDAGKDLLDDPTTPILDLSHSSWYLGEFDKALGSCSGSSHPKVSATVKTVVDLWEAGEKVLVFAFYRQTCRALRIHISHEIEQRMMVLAKRRLREAGMGFDKNAVERLIERIQDRFFDKSDSPGRQALDDEIDTVIQKHSKSLEEAEVSGEQRKDISDVMRRFLRVRTTIIRCFPLAELDTAEPKDLISRTLDYADISGVSWRQKFDGFITFLTKHCSGEERQLYLEAALRTQTGGIRVEDKDEDNTDGKSAHITLANVQVAMGETRRDARARLMRAFNTPFSPDILVCSEVMGEGVDLQQMCRHVIHHDLAWNPSSIEQRTGRIDRLGCKAEGRHPIVVYLPYLAGTADERQFQVMTEREQWFRIVMGQDEVAQLIPPDSNQAIPLPAVISDELSFTLDLGDSRISG
jgi:hypothetical protein